MPPLNKAYLRALPAAFRHGLKIMAALPDFNVEAHQLPSVANAEGLGLFSELTRTPSNPTRITSCNHQHFSVSGWLNWFDGDIAPVRDDDSLFKQVLPSPDLVTYFHNPQLTNNRFQLDVCCKTCVLNLTDPQGRMLTQVDLTQGVSHGYGAYGA